MPPPCPDLPLDKGAQGTQQKRNGHIYTRINMCISICSDKHPNTFDKQVVQTSNIQTHIQHQTNLTEPTSIIQHGAVCQSPSCASHHLAVCQKDQGGIEGEGEGGKEGEGGIEGEGEGIQGGIEGEASSSGGHATTPGGKQKHTRTHIKYNLHKIYVSLHKAVAHQNLTLHLEDYDCRTQETKDENAQKTKNSIHHLEDLHMHTQIHKKPNMETQKPPSELNVVLHL